MPKSLAEKIRRLRKERSLTQEALAEAADIQVRHVQRIEAGAGNPRLTTLCALGAALGVHPSSLLLD